MKPKEQSNENEEMLSAANDSLLSQHAKKYNQVDFSMIFVKKKRRWMGASFYLTVKWGDYIYKDLF